MKARNAHWWSMCVLITVSCLSVGTRLPGFGQAQAGQKDLQRLTVGYSPISGATLPFFIAVEERLFQKHGLEVAPVFFGGSPLINVAILAGEFPIGISGGGAIISSRLGGTDLTAIGSLRSVLTIDAWAKPEIKSPAQLKGKSVAITRIGTSTYFAGLSMLDSFGLKRTDVVFIQAGGTGESLAALMTGRVDVAMIAYPYDLTAKKAGFHLLFRPSETEYGLFPTTVIAARESWARDVKNRKVAIDVLRALNEGLLLARENATVSKRALSKYTRVDDDAALQGSFDFYKSAFSSTLRIVEKAMANALRFIDHPKAKQADVKQFYDNSLVDEAMRY